MCDPAELDAEFEADFIAALTDESVLRRSDELVSQTFAKALAAATPLEPADAGVVAA